MSEAGPSHVVGQPFEVEMVDGATDRAIADWLETTLVKAFERETAAEVRIALPGGSTPFPILEQVVHCDLPWSRLVVVPTDDRVLPEDHAASNTGKLRALFAPLGARIVSLGDAKPADLTASFDLVWLGMGADGHVASLFPNTDPQTDDPQTLRRITPDPLPPEAPFDRLTLTIPALLRTRRIVFVIRGEDKRRVFDAARRGAQDLPVARLLAANARGGNAPVTCFT